MAKKLTKKRKQTRSVNPKVHSDRTNGYNFSRYYINDLFSDIYDQLDKLSKKELTAVKQYCKSRTRNKALVNFHLMIYVIESIDFIIIEKKKQKNKI